MKRKFAVFLVILLTLSCAAFSEDKGHGFRVTKSDTAIAIAKAVIEQDFGKQQLKRYKWFEATVVGDTWKVYGHPYKRGEIPHHGGTVDVDIAVEGGTVLNILFEM